jgi:hypothetical protein
MEAYDTWTQLKNQLKPLAVECGKKLVRFGHWPQTEFVVVALQSVTCPRRSSLIEGRFLMRKEVHIERAVGSFTDGSHVLTHRLGG